MPTSSALPTTAMPQLAIEPIAPIFENAAEYLATDGIETTPYGASTGAHVVM